MTTGRAPALVIGDGSAPEIAQLLPRATTTARLVPAGVDPLEWITAALQAEPVDTLHIVAHGRPGAICLGGVWIDVAAICAGADLLTTWDVRRIALWSCDTGEHSLFAACLASLTGATVHASSRRIGQLDGGLCWTLDRTSAQDGGAACDVLPPFERSTLHAWPHQLASLSFANAYQVNTATTPAAKEANSHDFVFTSLGAPTISDNTNSDLFSGNDVCAIGININGLTYYGWISRPIKIGGVVKGFYFWTDTNFNNNGSAAANLAAAQQDGNQDGDGNVADNLGFILVVDQSYFNGLGVAAGAIGNVGSSSDRVDTALNALLPTNTAPTAVADTVFADEAGGSSNATAGTNPTGNVLSNDSTDAGGTSTYPSDTKTVAAVGTTSASQAVTASTTSSNGSVVAGQYGSLTLGADGSYSYVVDNSLSSVEALRTSSNTLTDIFTYTVKDSKGLTATSTLTVTIRGSNDTPTAVEDYNSAKVSLASTGQYTSTDLTGSLAAGNVLTNDTDKDSTANGETKAITGSTQTVAATVNTQSTSTASTTLQFSSSNGISSVRTGDHVYYQFAANDFRLLYASDQTTAIVTTSGGSNTSTTISLNATPAYYYTASGKVALTAGSYVVGFDSTTATTTSGNNVKTSTVQSTTSAGTTSLTFTSLPAALAVGMDVSGSANLQSGTKVASVTYAADGSGTVTSITLSKDPTASLNGAALTFSSSVAAGATMTGAFGTLVLNADGSYTYTPTANNPSLTAGKSATDTFSYTMQDASSATSTARLVITVQGSGTSDPNAVNDTASATEKSGVANGTAGVDPTDSLLTNDTTPSGSNTVVFARAAGASSDTAVTTNTAIVGLYGTLTVSSTGSYTYTVNNANASVDALKPGGTLTDAFTYTIQNTAGVKDTATLTVTVNGANDAPVAVNEAAIATEAGGQGNATGGYDPSGNLLSNDTDVDTSASSLTIASVRAGATEGSGTAATLSGSTYTVAGTYGTLTVNTNGTWSYAIAQSNTAVNALAAGQSLTESFNYTVSDGAGGSDTAVLAVTIQGAADTVAVNSVFVNEASPYAVFKVTGGSGVGVTLALGTAGLASTDVQATLGGTGADVANALEYYDGSAWQPYTGGSTVTLPGSGTLLVRVAVNQDGVYEGNESFTLTATMSDSSSARGIGTINDEGTGDVFGGGNTTGTADSSGADDDRPTISISSPSAVEGSPEDFTVSIDKTSTRSIGFTPTLASGTATVGSDTASTLQYYNTATSTWVDVTGSVSIAAGASSVKLRVATVDDTTTESNETFTVSTGYVSLAKNPSGVSGTATINDNDSAGLTISKATVTTSEAATTDSFTVKLATQPTSDVTVTLTGLDATEGSLSATTLTFTSANWNTAQTVTVTGVDDTLFDGSINYTLTATSSVAGGGDANYAGKTATVAATNQDNDTAPSFAISNVTVTEGGQATFTVTRSGATGDAVAVNWASSNGTATAGADYTAGSGTLSFAAGVTSQTFTVATTDDSLAETAETINVTLSNATGGAVIGTATATATITDNDAAGLTISKATVTTSEAATTDSFTVKLATQPTSDVTVTLTGLDTTEGSLDKTTLTFTSANWNTAQTVTVTGVDDTLFDGSINYTLTATSSVAGGGDANYAGKSATVAATNQDNDTAPSFAVSNVTVTEGGQATFTVTRSGATGDAVAVDWASSNGTATAGADYTAGNGTLSFAAGVTSQTFTVATTDDSLAETAETINVTLSNATGGAVIGTATATATITDNDSAGIVLSKAQLTTTEAATTDSFTVKLATQPTSDVTVTLTGLDTTEGSLDKSTLTFTSANWNTAQTVTVTGVDDTLFDGNINYTLTATSSVAGGGDANYAGKSATVAATNQDNDSAPSFAIGNVTVTEGGQATFTVTRSGATGDAVAVNWASSNGTATAGADYTAGNGTLSFAAGETSKTITLVTTDDSLAETAETINVTLSNATGVAVIGTATATATINDNDAAGLTISKANLTTSEATTTDSFTVKLNSQPTSDVTVTLTGLDTTEGSLSATTLTFTSANWNTAQTVTVTGVDDTLFDGNINYTLTATSSVAGGGDANYAGKSATVAATNQDNDTAPSFAIGNVTVTEGGQATFTVTRSGATGDAVAVDWASSNGTATAGADYTAGSGTLSFAAGVTSQTFTVATTDDSLAETAETINVTLSNATGGAVIGTATATATITDNDSAGIVLSKAQLTTTEAATTDSFTVKLATQPTSDVTVTLTGLDTTEGSLDKSTLTFTSANWNTAQTVTVTGVDDTLFDGSINYTLTATSSVAGGGDANYAGKSATVAATNQDNDSAPSFAISNVTVTEGGQATFTVTRSGATGDAVAVNWASSNGTATAGADYTGGSGTLSFAAGVTSQSFTIATTDDSLAETAETINVTLSNATGGAVIGTATATATINDNDAAGLTISKATVTTSETGTTDSFTVKLATQPTSDVTVTLTGLDATEGSLSATTLTFTSANWNTAQTVTVTGVDDTLFDGNINYTLTATSSVAGGGDANYAGKSATVAATNQDNDTAPSFAISNVTVTEGGQATFTVTRSGATGDAVAVDWASSNGTATAGADYTAGSGTLSFAAGVTSQSFTIATTDDSLAETAETINLTLSNATGVSVIGTATATATINDNDSAGLTISKANVTTSEATTTDSFTVKLNSQPTSDVTVTLTGLDATEGSLSATTLTFTSANWNTAQTVTVTGVDDTLFDGNINYTLTATSSVGTGGDANYAAKTATVAATNQDNDSAPSFAIGNVTVTEGGQATFTVTRSGATGDAVAVDWASSNGTATAGADYTAGNGTLNFAAGETSKTFALVTTDDSLAETTETINVTLSNATGVSMIGTATATATINDNDAAGLTISKANLTTSEATTTDSFTVKLATQPTSDVTVTLTGLDATEGSLSATTLTFTSANWNTAQTVTVTGVDDTLFDGNINYTLTATSSVAGGGDANYAGKSATVAATNQDNDTAPSFAVSNVTVTEGGQATFTVTRSGATGDAVAVDWASSNGTATAGADYTAGNGTLNFAAGETSKTFALVTTDDSLAETTETINVTLSSPTGGAVIGTATATATITDNDAAGLTISKATVTTSEAATTDSFTVKLATQPTSDVTVTLTGLDTTEGSLDKTTLTFTSANWNTAQTVTVTGVDDTLFDGNINYTLTATSSVGSGGDANYAGKSATVAATNQDNDTAPSFAVSNVTVTEGGQATFTVTRSGATGDAVAVNWASSNGTATAGSDYTGGNGTLNFAAGVTSQTFTIATTDDSLAETAETINVTLSNATGVAVIGTATATATINDNDAAGLTISKANLTTSEATTTDSFTIKLNSQPTSDVTVTLTGLDTTEGSLSATTLTFTSANWNTAQTVTVTGVDDTLFDGNINYTLTATSSVAGGGDANYAGKSATVAATNQDNDTAPSFAISNVTVTEGGQATFTVTRSGATGDAVAVDWASSNGTATAGADYTAGNGTLNFAAGVTSQTFTIATTDDSLAETAETINVTLSNATGVAVIGTATATATINDNDAAGLTISKANLTTSEATTTDSFTVKLNSQPTSDVTVTLTGLDTTEGSLSATTLTFTSANWNTAQTVTVTGVDDTLFDGNINYTLTATSSVGSGGDANYAGKSATVAATNQDNDTAPSFAIGNVTVTEGGQATFTVTRSGATGDAVAVDWASSNGTATAGADYTAGSGTLSFAAGVTSQTFTIATTDDSLAETAETINVTLSNATGGAVIGTATATATITDNDAAGLAISGTTLTTSESGTQASFSVRLTSQPTSDVTVTLTGLDATEGVLDKTTLTFTGANWNQPQGVTVTGVDDKLVDGNIGYTLTAISSGDASYAGANAKTGTVQVTNTDDDAAGLAISGTTLTTSESGTQASFTVKLTSQPTSDVTVTLTGLDTTEGALDKSTLTFTSANWNTAQSVTVTGVDDKLVDGNIAYTLTATSSGDSSYAGADAKTGTVLVTNQDDDSAGLTISKANVTTSEAATTDSFTVKLNTQPVSDVTVTLTGLDATEGSLSATTLTFTSANWNTAQTVTVTGVDDTLFDGNINYTLTATSSVGSGGDANYAGKSATVAATNQDNDTVPSFAIGNVTVTEGGQATFTVTRSGATGDAVAVDWASSNGTATAGFDYTAGSGTLSFAAGVTSQTFTIATTDDSLAETAETINVTLSNATGGAVIGTATATATITDNDAAGLAISGTTLTTSESGTQGSFSVKLTSQPTSEVTVTLTGLDTTEGSLDKNTLTFTSANWNQAQSVTVTGVDDKLVDGNIGYTLTATSSGDASYAGADAKTGTVQVTNIDDDAAGLAISGTTLTTSESGTQASFSVKLTSQPTSDVTVTLTGLDATEGVLNKSTLTFNASNWNQPQTVSVTGIDDAVTDGDQHYALVATSSGDATYDGANAKAATVQVTNTDVPPPPPPLTADLDPDSDVGAKDHVTDVLNPDFVVNAGNVLQAGQTARLLAPDGAVVGDVPVTPTDVSAGTVKIPTIQLDDGVYTFMAQIVADGGQVVREAPVTVTIVTDRDGVAPSTELAANNGDFNRDGVKDWEQNNVAQLPLTSVEAFQQGARAPADSFGALMAGTIGVPGGAVQLDAGAQLQNVKVLPMQGALPSGTTAASPLLDFSVAGVQATVAAPAGGALTDVDPTQPGLQTRVVLDLPGGVDANTYLKWSSATGTWSEFLDDQRLDTFDSGATLLDTNRDGLVDRVVLTFTDGGAGDDDGIANGSIVDPGLLALRSTPVYSILLANGDRFYTVDAAEAARTAAGTGNVFEGARFDSLAANLGGQQAGAYHQPFTDDWFFASSGAAMPYACYEPAAGAGFMAAAPGAGVGEVFHLYLNAAGLTQLVTPAQAGALNLGGQGYSDRGAQFATTTSSAFVFDPKGCLLANQADPAVRGFVQTLAATYASTSDPRFFEAVEQAYLERVQVVGVAHGAPAGVAEFNAAFGTHFVG